MSKEATEMFATDIEGLYKRGGQEGARIVMFPLTCLLSPCRNCALVLVCPSPGLLSIIMFLGLIGTSAFQIHQTMSCSPNKLTTSTSKPFV